MIVPQIQFSPTGPSDARIMIVGEAPGKTEVALGAPFVGTSGNLLNELLSQAGINRSECFVTNVVRERPPGSDINNFFALRKKDITPEHQLVMGKWADPRIRFGLERLKEEIRLVKPEMVLAFGNVAMWALSEHWGIQAWRGSELQGDLEGIRFQLIPTMHPAAVFRENSVKGLIQLDLARAARKRANGREVKLPPWNFLVRPTFDQAKETLERILDGLSNNNSPTKFAADIETRGGHIACFGIAWSKFDAICIPFMCVERLEGYWPLEQEVFLARLVRRILTHPNARVVGQNWNYDRQYFHRWHGYTPRLDSDTMAKHHAMFSNSRKGLGFLSSLYCEFHRFWKDDGRLWDPSMDEEKFWRYNCEDCVRTYEVDENENQAIATMTPEWPKLPEIVKFQTELHDPIFRMMVRGFRVDHKAKATVGGQLLMRSMEIQAELEKVAGIKLNINSPAQMASFLYGNLPLTPVKARRADGTWGVTTNDDALQTIAGREPLLRKFVARVQALRSASTFDGNYIRMRSDIDGRMRCTFTVPGTITYRLISDENAFGSGRNLQNIPGSDEIEDAVIPLPNIRKFFVPDQGYTIFDLDGDSADLRFVTWESDCRQMKAYFAAGEKPYVEIAKEYYRDPTITKYHPSYRFMKALCHGTNYGGEGMGLSHRIGLLVKDVERMQKWYFGMCPEIKQWQEDIRNQVRGRGWIENPFGYRIYFRDRITRETENEALAWTPQSSVALLINHAAKNIDDNLPWAQLLLQVHDSLTGQFPIYLGERAKRELLEQARIPVQTRSGELIVPMGLKCSDKSWGDCE